MLLPIFELEMKEKYFLLQLKLKIEKVSGNTRKIRKIFSIFELKGKGHEPSSAKL